MGRRGLLLIGALVAAATAAVAGALWVLRDFDGIEISGDS